MARDLRELKVAAAQHIRERDYWLNIFSGEPGKSNFPYDYIKESPGTGIDVQKEFPFKWETSLSAQLMALTKQKDQALHVVLLSALAALLGRYTGQKDITLATPIYRQAGTGQFINTVLPLRMVLAGRITFKQLLDRVKQVLLEAIVYQAYPVELLPELLEIRQQAQQGPGFPLFDTALILENIHPMEYLEHLTLGIVFHFTRIGQCLEAVTFYNAQLYREFIVAQIAAHFNRFMQNALDKPDKEISIIEILSEAEKNQLLTAFNDTQTDYPGHKTIHELFAEQAAQTPNSIALIAVDACEKREKHEKNERQEKNIETLCAASLHITHITYFQLNEQSSRLAGELIEKGITSGDIVAIMMGQSIELVTGILGILKAGGAYLPIDHEYPQERIDYMLKDSGAKLLALANEANELEGGKMRRWEGERRGLQHSKQIAYIIYTSGSTGQPKGVMVTHQNVVRLVKNTNFVPLNKETRILQTGAPVFDATTFEMWGSLLNGGQLVLVAKETILDGRQLEIVLKNYQINTLWLSAPLFSQLMQENIELFESLTYLLVGGDVLLPGHINQVRYKFPGLKIINGYGPTENTTFSTTYLIEKEFEKNIPVGKPIANSTAYIFDINGNGCLSPIGAIGELVVGGDGVAQGYLNNPELTNKSFCGGSRGAVFSKKAPPVYRTGDLARWLPDGNIEFLGRIDQQVKIRGFRIELKEIENYLAAHEGIKETVVTAGCKNGEKYLSAYIVPRSHKSLGDQELRAYLGRRLPDYMIPSFFITLTKIPLNRSGKIDRGALPEPFEKPQGAYIPPRDPIEKELVTMFADVLGIKAEQVGITTNFFKSGGHSLKAARLIAKIHRAFNVVVPISQVFKTPTIEQLGQFIKTSREDKYTVIPAVEKKEFYLLSPIQKRFYILYSMKGVDTAFNLVEAVIISGALNLERLEKAFQLLIKRHESLRTSFVEKDGEPVQVVHESVDFHIEFMAVEEQNLQNLVLNFMRPFDFKRAPLLRVKVVKLACNKHLLYIETHHILSDGTSQVIMVRELLAIYGENELPPLRIQYKDVAEWQLSLAGKKVAAKYENYWLTQFKEKAPTLNIFTDFPRPASQSFKGGCIHFAFEEDLWRKITQLAVETETTLFMILLAALNVLLFKYTGNEDIVIGTAVAGRKDAELENILGVFINPLALRNRPGKEKTFAGFLSEVKANTLAAYENQAYPFDDLIEKINLKRDTVRNPLFDIDLVLLNMDLPRWEIEGLTVTTYEYNAHVTQMDIAFYVLEVSTETGKRIDFSMFYCTDLFKRESMERLAGFFKEIMLALVKNKDRYLRDIDISYQLQKTKTDIYDSLGAELDF